MKIKTLVFLMLAFGLLFGGFSTYLKSLQLQKPLILTHYYEKEFFQSNVDYISLYYITNRDEHFQLISVQSEALPNQMIFVEHDSVTHIEGIYKQHEAILRIKGIEEKEVILDNLIFNFSNGTAIEGDIGMIKLSPMKGRDSKEQVVNFSTSGSSNNGESYTVGNVLRDSKLTRISLPFPDILNPVFKLDVEKSEKMNSGSMNHDQLMSSKEKVNSEKIDLPIGAASGEMLKVNAMVDKSLMYKNDIHAIDADIIGTFKIGNEEVEQGLIRITEQPYLTSRQIKELKNQREEGEQ
ncbi:MAG: hypothetical protein ACQEUT_15090 [Bacillota bacterium]